MDDTWSDPRAAMYHAAAPPQIHTTGRASVTPQVSPSHNAGFLGKEASETNWMRHANIKPKRRRRKVYLGGGNGSIFSISIITSAFRWRGTAYGQVFLPACIATTTAAVWAMGIGIVDSSNTAEDFPLLPREAFSPMMLVALSIACYRLYVAHSNCTRGAELIRIIGHAAEEMMIVCVTSPIVRESHLELQEISRKINVLLAFIRQDLRESRQHEDSTRYFRRGSARDQQALQAFFTTPVHYAQDPHGAPPLVALLSQEEIDYYSNFKPHARVLVLVAELSAFFKQHVNYGSSHMTTPEGKVFDFELRRIRDSWSACNWIVKTPTPYALHQFTLTVLFLFVIIIAPLFYAIHEKRGTYGAWMACPLAAATAVAFYGIEAVAVAIEVPFGWRENDCNLTSMCRSVLKNTATLFKVRKAIDRGLSKNRQLEGNAAHTFHGSSSHPTSPAAVQDEQQWGATGGGSWQ